MTNVPVRFVRADGQTIQLPVTTLTLDVDRGTMAMPLPLLGSTRLGVDLNLSKAVILMEGVFTDDDLFNIGTPTASSSIIDFSRAEEETGSSINENTRFDNDNEIEIILQDRTVDDLTGVSTGIMLQSTDGTVKTLYGTKSSESHSQSTSFGVEVYQFSIGTTFGIQGANLAAGGSGYSIGNNIATSGGAGSNCKVNITGVNSGAVTSFTIAHPGKNFAVGNTITISGGGGDATFTVSQVGTALTATQMAKNLVALINDGTLSNPINEYSASLVPSPSSGESDVAVRITQTVVGPDGDTNTPKFTGNASGWPWVFKPRFNTFDGGSNAEGVFHGMSAGDKVMSLYATLNNSIPMGLSAGVALIGGAASAALKLGDYITGIQIPFNSSINAEDGQKYKPVNFFMPTGVSENVNTKSVENAVSASTKVDSPFDGDDRAFIKGFVTKATFVQIAGEPVYTFNIQFTPANIIL
jgi:hypothetical protein